MFLSPTGQLGGAETSLLEILASLRDAQPSWRLHLLTAADGPLVARASALGVETTVLPWPPAVARLGEAGAASARGGYWRLCGRLLLAAVPTLGYLRRLRAAIRRASPDVVHTNGLKMHLLGVRARARAPVVWHLHDYLGSRPMTARLLRSNAARAAVVVANSASVAEDVRAALRHRVRVVTIYNGIDLDPLLAARRPPRSRRPLGSSAGRRRGRARRAARDVRPLEGARHVPARAGPGAARAADPRLHHRRRALPDRRRASIHATSWRAWRRRSASPIGSASPASSIGRKPRCAPSTSSSTPAPSPSRSVW